MQIFNGFWRCYKVYSNRHTDVAFVVRDITKNSTGEMTFMLMEMDAYIFKR